MIPKRANNMGITIPQTIPIIALAKNYKRLIYLEKLLDNPDFFIIKVHFLSPFSL